MTTPPAPTHPRRRAIAVAAPAVAGLLLFAGCSKKDDTTTSTASSSTTVTTSAKSGGGSSSGTTPKGTTPGTTPTSDAVKINKDVWYQGFKISLGSGKIDDAKEQLLVDVTIENLGPDNSSVYGDFSIEQDGTVVEQGNLKDNSTVVAGSKAKDTLQFDYSPDKIDFDKATLLMGTGNQSQVRVPLGSTGDLVDRKPVEQKTPDAVTIGAATFTPKSVVTRWDDPKGHSQAPKDTTWLVVTFDAKNTTSDQTFYLKDTAVSLSLPDGTKQTPKDMRADPLAPTKTQPVELWFDIKGDWTGDYTLDLGSQPTAADGSDATGTPIKLTLSEKSSGAGTTTTTAKRTTG